MIVAGKRCPYCKGPLDAVVEFRPDHHSETGYSEVRTYQPHRMPQRISSGDRKVTRVVESGSFKGDTIIEWEHRVTGYCKRCCRGFADEQMEDGEPVRGAGSALATGGGLQTTGSAG